MQKLTQEQLHTIILEEMNKETKLKGISLASLLLDEAPIDSVSLEVNCDKAKTTNDLREAFKMGPKYVREFMNSQGNNDPVIQDILIKVGEEFENNDSSNKSISVNTNLTESKTRCDDLTIDHWRKLAGITS